MSKREQRGRALAHRQKTNVAKSLRRARRTTGRRVALTAAAALAASGLTGLSAHAADQDETVNLVKDIRAGVRNSGISNLHDADGRLYFTANDGTHGRELWTSDGTAAGTTMVADLTAGPGSSHIMPVGNLGGTFFFSHNYELWKTTGTRASTVKVSDVTPEETYSDSTYSYSVSSATANGTLFFSGNDDGEHGSELWKTDGTAAGTTMVKDINGEQVWVGHGNTYTRGSSPSGLTAIGDTVYFSADDGEHGRELWKTNGTAAGTTMVKDISGVHTSTYSGYTYTENRSSSPGELTAVGNTLYFSADDGEQGRQLWKTNGTAGTTTSVTDFDTSQYYAGPPQSLTAVGNTLFFSADDGEHGRELWKTNGTAAGTTMVKDIYGSERWTYDGYSYSSNRSSRPSWLTAVGDTLYFTAQDQNGLELWRSDGTASGTTAVPSPSPDPWGYSWRYSPRYLTAANGALYFTASADDHTVLELWSATESRSGATQISSLEGGYYRAPRELTASSNVLFFTADDGPHGRELWRVGGAPVPPPTPPTPPAPPVPPKPAAKAGTNAKATAKFAPKKRVATIKVKVTSKNAKAGKVTGKVRIQVKRGKKNIRTATVNVNAKGVATLKVKKKFLKAKGLYKVTAQYRGSTAHKASKDTAQFRVKKKG